MIYKFEVKKLYGSVRYLAILIVLTVVAVIFQYAALNITLGRDDNTDEAYRQYIDILQGPLSEEKVKYISNEKTKIQECIDNNDSMTEKYLQGEISRDEFSVYNEEYHYAVVHEAAIEQIDNTSKRIEGNGGWFVYETGWKKLFSTSIYSALFVLIAVAVFSMYSGTEFDTGMWQYLYSSPDGREKTVKAKCVNTVVGAFVGFVIYQMARYFVFVAEGNIEQGSAPACSIGLYSSMNNGISIFKLYFMSVLMQGIAMAGIALITLIVTYMLKKSQASMIIMIVLYLIPYMIKDYSAMIFAVSLPGSCNLLEGIAQGSAKMSALLIIVLPLLIFIIGCLLAVGYIRCELTDVSRQSLGSEKKNHT